VTGAVRGTAADARTACPRARVLARARRGRRMRAKAQCRPRMRSSLGRRHRRRSQEVVTHRRWRRAPRNAGSYPAGVVSQPVADGARPMQGHSKSHQQRILRLQKLPQCMLSTLRLIAVRSAPPWSAAEVRSMQQQGHAGRPAPAAKPERKQDLGAARDEADDAGIGHAPGRAARAAPAAARPARRAARPAVLGTPAAGDRRVRGRGAPAHLRNQRAPSTWRCARQRRMLVMI